MVPKLIREAEFFLLLFCLIHKITDLVLAPLRVIMTFLAQGSIVEWEETMWQVAAPAVTHLTPHYFRHARGSLLLSPLLYSLLPLTLKQTTILELGFWS